MNFSIDKMSKDGDKEADKDFDAALKQVGENPKYKVLTKEEYEILMGGAIPKTSTPRATLSVKPPTAPFTPRTPGAAPFRMQQLLDKMKDPTGKGTNLSTIDQSFAYPPLAISPNYQFSVVRRNLQKGKSVMKSGNMRSNACRNLCQNMSSCCQLGLHCGVQPGIC